MEKEKLIDISFSTLEIVFTPVRRHIFGVMDTYPSQVKLLIDYMIKDFKLKDPNVALVYADNEAGKVDREAAIDWLKRKYNITPVTIEILAPGAIDATSQIMSIKRSKANAILHVGTIPSTSITLLRDASKIGLVDTGLRQFCFDADRGNKRNW